MNWFPELHTELSRLPRRFNNILEVADFLEMDRKWVPRHVIKWSNDWEHESKTVKQAKLQVIASVGHLKSNWVFLEIVKELLNDYPKFDNPILFGAESDDAAMDMTIRVKEALESDQVKEEFGNLRGEKWTDKQLWIRGRAPFLKGANFFSVGVKGALEGRRYNLAFLDDPIGLKKAISKAERDYVEKWISNQFWPRINWPWGARLLVIGSYWGPLDVYHYLPKEHNVKVKVYPAHKDNKNYSNLLWPEGMPKGEMKRLRKDMPESTYQLRYLCNDKGMTGIGFKPEWFDDNLIAYNKIPFDKLLIHQGWDLAITEEDIRGRGQQLKEEPDFTAGIVGGIDNTTGDIYIIDLYIKRIALGHEDVIENMYKKWPKTSVVGIETNQFQKLVYNLVRAKKSAIPAVEVPHYGLDKITRILNLEPYFKTNRIHVLDTLPHLDNFYHEYLSFPTEGRHDDILDALEILIHSFTQGQATDLGGITGRYL